MQNDEGAKRYGMHGTVSGLHESLRLYIEAQYHIRDEGLVAERNALLQEPKVIAQKAFVEATPVYAFGKPYESLDIPDKAKAVLTEISAVSDNSGLYPTPYKHQADALEAFLGPERRELVIATGTGSGKTESFLMPIVATLATESEERVQSRSLPGCRALLLYPMNALVNDQVARIRRLLGNNRVSDIVSAGRDRPVRFGSYTGRTSYPGPRTDSRDGARIAPLFEDFYKRIEQRPELKATLQSVGRWPSKDLVGFYNDDAAVKKVYNETAKRAGQSYTGRNWKHRLITQPDDRELMTRHEMQESCPDILVTNYSMLEYMLMRPIESAIFEQTSKWLEADDRNELILVLDEAHMYRGAGGAEVALLIRRLIARLGIPRSRVRCILTSASLGDSDGAIADAEKFALDLTGSSDSDGPSRFRVVRGTLESRPEGRHANATEVEALSQFRVDQFGSISNGSSEAIEEVSRLAIRLGWPSPPTEYEGMQDYLFTQLSSLPLVDFLIKHVSGKATALDVLTKLLCPNNSSDIAARAADSLFALCSHAKRHKDGRVLVPTRLHLFHRGLPGLYACADPQCSGRLAAHEGPTILGKFHTKPLLACTCKSNARVFGFHTHRDCGAAFITGWVDENCNFVWHESEAANSRSLGKKLFPIEMSVDDKAHSASKYSDAWLHYETGHLLRTRPKQMWGFRHVRIPVKHLHITGELTFDECPVCCRKTKRVATEPSKIMDHVTKGEAPFATLVRAQMFHQSPSREKNETYPNEGRKVLVFSDGRQKAARLARDLPRDMELDVFRAAVAVAASMLFELSLDAKPTNSVLYVAFLAVLAKNNLSMFDGTDAERLDQHIATIRHNYKGDLEAALDDKWSVEPPWRYRYALLKLLCGSYYSLSGTTIGFIEPSKIAWRRVREMVGGKGIVLGEAQLRSLAVAWIDELLDSFSFEMNFHDRLREKASGYPRMSWGSKGQFRSQFKLALIGSLGESVVNSIEEVFRSCLAEKKEGFFINPNSVKLTIDLQHNWVQCDDCTGIMPLEYSGGCLLCGSEQIRLLDPATDPYLKARKSFWRLPVADALTPGAAISNISVEEHTAQLSNRDYRNVHSTTELHELRFQDILLNDKDRPVDVLSCTTTMEVGIDIGSLVAVALRNVPPQRENYQQRAGRAGRRGASVSSVVSFSQNGPHDSYYFLNPEHMVAGSPRSPELKVENPKIARRHVHAYLIQTFFQETSNNSSNDRTRSAVLLKALGKTREFFSNKGEGPNLELFSSWLQTEVFSPPHKQALIVASWLPDGLTGEKQPVLDWVLEVAQRLLDALQAFTAKQDTVKPKRMADSEDEDDEDEDDEDLEIGLLQNEDLLEFLFFHQLLPTYAFPTSLCSFLVEEWRQNAKGYKEIKLEQQPQQSTAQALSEYAPGRLVVINKKTYRSGGVFASTPAPDGNRAAELFEPDNAKSIVICEACSFVHDPYAPVATKPHDVCPVCEAPLKTRLMIEPQVFGPENARALSEEDQEQEFTFATMAQYPQPTNVEAIDFEDGGHYLRYAHAIDKRLLTLNKGKTVQREGQGFSVCNKCGCAEVYDEVRPRTGNHTRPYLLSNKTAPVKCDGEFVRTFLGYSFSTDLLLVRIKISPPLVTDIGISNHVQVLESAAHSMAEALRLAASRHRQLDLDPTEFGSGHRILPLDVDGNVFLDIYLYDTLSGGAGYAELAAKYFKEIASDTLALLEGCDCDTSCTDCLDHFHNQHLKSHLNRKLAASLLRYGLYGIVPRSPEAHEQEISLRGLASYLLLDDIECEFGVVTQGKSIPLVARANGNAIAINLYPALLARSDVEFPRAAFNSTYQLTELELRRDLPSIHAEIRKRLT
ncbi:ATP-dependent RNA helicase RhlE [Alcaligenes phenolicus]